MRSAALMGSCIDVLQVADSMALLREASKLPPNKSSKEPDFYGKVALITGGGEGLGRAYALLFAKLGAKVIVNDLRGAEKVAQQIRDAGGDATAETTSVENGAAVVGAVIKKYGRIDLIVNNAGKYDVSSRVIGTSLTDGRPGILRDKAFANMTDDLWFPVIDVHLRGTYSIVKAAWPHLQRQKYGRIVNITSTSGIYGQCLNVLLHARRQAGG
jgi:multifunctional beta-oxidation protein